MSDPYIGEIRMFGGNFAPAGWVLCQGQLMPISENDALFTLIGTTYGGDGQETFGIPDLQGRVPIHQGQGPGITQTYTIGEKAGVESVTLQTQQMPIHNHALLASSGAGTSANASAHVLAAGPSNQVYTQDVGSVSMASNMLSPIGGSQPHENMAPYLCLNYILSLFGIFPPQS
jgi:microcystin-dependent protein